MSCLSVNNIAKQYNKRRVVDNVSLQVNSGEIVGLLGPNGAGKTTTFHIIVGLVKPEGGEIYLDQLPITRMPMHARAQQGLGYLPQEPSVFRKLTVAENLRAVLEIRDDLSPGQRELMIDELLQEFNITHLRDQLAVGLSGGERRRLEIARALAIEPKFMLLDEPFAGVDPISILDIQNVIKQLRQSGIGILITEHNVRETLGICDRAYIVNEGKMMAEGTPDEILSHAEVRKVYLGEAFEMQL